jgi:tetratricopeptide (TPR) repeat protein
VWFFVNKHEVEEKYKNNFDRKGESISDYKAAATGVKYMSRKQLSYYKNYLEGELFIDYLLAQSDSSLIKVQESTFAEVLAKKEHYEKLERTMRETANNNNKGITYEKDGKVDQAILAYEKNLEMAYPALHSYERLMILYRKEKRYDDEIRVIRKAINDFPAKSHKVYTEKWEERLEKAKKYIKKI